MCYRARSDFNVPDPDPDHTSLSVPFGRCGSSKTINYLTIT
jgi:hypothetical protein